MRRIVIIILAFAYFCTSCIFTDSNNQNKVIENTNNRHNQVEIEYSEEVILGESNEADIIIYFQLQNKFLNSDKQNDIVDYISKLFKKNIAFKSYSEKSLEAFTKYDGIIQLSMRAIPHYYEYREEVFTPLNFILEDNIIRNEIPDYLLNDIKDNDGEIWCIPAEMKFYKPIRIYNEKLFNETPKAIPTDIYEFYDWLNKINKKYNMESIINVRKNRAATEFYDIFSAFGCLIDKNGSTINWNLETKSFEDYILANSKAIEALRLIESIRNLGFISFIDNSNNILLKSGEIGTTMQFATNPRSAIYSFSLAPAESIEYVKYNNSFVNVLPINTENAEQSFIEFLHIFYCDEEGNMIGRYGMNNASVNYDNLRSVIISIDKLKINGELGIVGEWLSLNPYIQSTEKTSFEERKSREMTYYEYSDWLLKKVESKSILTIPLWPDFRALDIQNENITTVFEKMFYKFLKGNETASDFFDNYKKVMKDNGGNAYLNHLNSRVDSKTKYHY